MSLCRQRVLHALTKHTVVLKLKQHTDAATACASAVPHSGLASQCADSNACKNLRECTKPESEHLLACGNRLKAFWQLVNTVTMTHPHTFFVYIMLTRVVSVQLAAPRSSYDHAAIFSPVCCLVDNATKLLDHQLHPIADTKHRNLLAVAVLKETCWDPRRPFNVHRVRSARQYDCLRIGVLDAVLQKRMPIWQTCHPQSSTEL